MGGCFCLCLCVCFKQTLPNQFYEFPQNFMDYNYYSYLTEIWFLVLPSNTNISQADIFKVNEVLKQIRLEMRKIAIKSHSTFSTAIEYT